MIGTAFGHYQLLEEIGAGGMGRVYRAHDSRLERDVAIKVLPPLSFTDPHSRKRFRKEALALSRLNHPNIATVHDFDTLGDLDYLVMEYIPGVSLDQKIAHAPLAEKEIVRLGAQLAEGLVAAHQEGILHRDLKPANLRVTPEGRLKILDFGLAKAQDVNVAASTSSEPHSAIAGTLPYMAPEQLLGEKLDTRTDLYAAGNVLYEMATGKPPFERALGSRMIDEILHQPSVAPRALNPRISPGLETVILKCLEKSAENRYQSAGELAVDLRRLASASASSNLASQSSARPRHLWRVLALSLVPVLAIASLLYYARWRLLARQHEPIRSLAVLPLINVSGDPAQEYFADGMTDELISRMARAGEPRVISLTSSMHYKGTHKPLKDIANELGVDAVVEGSVLRSGKQVRITAELIDAASDQHLWANSYNRDVSDVLGLQDEVAEAVSSQVGAQLRLRGRSSQQPLDPQVYEAYLRGRFEWNKRTPEGAQAALDYFHQAVLRDPKYAAGYAGIADCYLTLGPSLHATSLALSLSEARAAVGRALQLDPDLAEAHATLAEISLIADWDWAKAETEFKRALQLNPGYATAHHWYGLYLGYDGRAVEARRELELAHDLDPHSAIIRSNLGWSYYIERDYENTIRTLRQTLAQNPDFWVAHWGLGSCYVQKGWYPLALSELQKAVDLSQGDSGAKASLVYAQAAAGHRQIAEKMLRELQQTGQKEPVDIAIIYVALGDREQAITMLKQAYSEHSQSLLLLKTDPWLDGLRADPRIQELIKKIGFS